MCRGTIAITKIGYLYSPSKLKPIASEPKHMHRPRPSLRTTLPLILLALFLVLPSVLSAQTPWICSASVPVAPKQMDISLSGTVFKITFGPDFGPPPGTYTWYARGFVVRGFTTTTEYAAANDTSTYNAQFEYGQTLLNKINGWGTNMLRFLVSEKVLSNDQNKDLVSTGWYTTAQRSNYMTCLRNAIQFARNNGFVADIAMQAECPAGDCSGPNARNPMASQQTKDAWSAINGWFKNDKGVIYELYNEPGGDTTIANWNKYLHDGDSTTVSMSNLVNQVRNGGSKNVLIVDGLTLAKSLQNILNSQVVNAGGYPLHDPIEDSVITTPQIAYGVHFYPDGEVTTNSQFDTLFGNQHAQLPIVFTEFAAWGSPVPPPGGDPGLGLAGQPIAQVIRFVNYLNQNRIGLNASAFDVPGVMYQTIPANGVTPTGTDFVPTDYDDYHAGMTAAVHPTPNVGLLLKKFYTDNYNIGITYTAADACTTGLSTCGQ